MLTVMDQTGKVSDDCEHELGGLTQLDGNAPKPQFLIPKTQIITVSSIFKGFMRTE